MEEEIKNEKDWETMCCLHLIMFLLISANGISVPDLKKIMAGIKYPIEY